MSRKVKDEIRNNIKHTSFQTPFHLVKITQIVKVIMIKSQKYY